MRFQGSSNEANWANGGQVLMAFFSLFYFFVRCLLQLNVYLIQQLPATMHARIDADIFLRAFTMMNNGERVNAGTWSTAPNGSGSAYWAAEDNPAEPVVVPEGDLAIATLREEHIKQWNDHVYAASAMMPSQLDRDVRCQTHAGQRGRRNAKKNATNSKLFSLSFVAPDY